jgi:hypothetical protein
VIGFGVLALVVIALTRGPPRLPNLPPRCSRSGKSLGGSSRTSFGGVKRRKGAHSPRSAGSCDPVMEPIRSFQTVSEE